MTAVIAVVEAVEAEMAVEAEAIRHRSITPPVTVRSTARKLQPTP